jgi:hypothetical protein
VSLGPTGRQRQHGVEAIERLNRRFFIDGEHGRMIRRIDVQPNDVGRLRLEIGVVRLHVAFEAMRLQTGALPSFGDEIVMNLQQPTQLARTPVRAAVGRRLPRLFQDARFHGRRQHRRRLPFVSRPQALQPCGHKSGVATG